MIHLSRRRRGKRWGFVTADEKGREEMRKRNDGWYVVQVGKESPL